MNGATQLTLKPEARRSKRSAEYLDIDLVDGLWSVRIHG